jgi:predicted transposase YbfD/YdcC
MLRLGSATEANQKSLLQQITINTSEPSICTDFFEQETQARGRLETRQTFVYKDLTGISSDWIGLKRLIRVERTVVRQSSPTIVTKKKKSHETAYYISSIRSNKASLFGYHIRDHWGIENRLHWVKDAIMNEDKSKTVKGMAAENISILRNIAINVFRTNGFDSVKYAMEQCVNNIQKLIVLTKYIPAHYKIT